MMIARLYDFFEKMGYSHPLHPPFTHGPIGAVIVGLCFGLMLWRQQNYLQPAYHAAAIALVLFFPTVLVGIMDWQHYYAGAWIFPIKMKITLAAVLFLLLSAILIVGRLPGVRPSIMIILFMLCLFDVIGLGYFGGEMVFESKKSSLEGSLKAGWSIFNGSCSGCHSNGGNLLYPSLPLCTAPQLISYEKFTEFVRNPKLPNGSKGPMPAFSQHDLSDLQIHALYQYNQQTCKTHKS